MFLFAKKKRQRVVKVRCKTCRRFVEKHDTHICGTFFYCRPCYEAAHAVRWAF